MKATLPVAHFDFEGKRYRIFKREDRMDAPWYLYFERRKQRFKRCLDSNVQESAIAAAKRIVMAVKREDWEALEGTKLRQPAREGASALPQAATIGQVVEVYQGAALETSEKSKAGNVWSLRNCLRRVYGAGADVDGLLCSVLDGEFVRKFFVEGLERARAVEAQALSKGKTNGQQLGARVKRSANSLLNQAKAVFRPKCLGIYRRAGLVVPDMEALNVGFKEERFEKVSKLQFNPPGDGVVAATLAAWPQLEDRNMFLAVGLELGFGLRKGEIGQARWSWLLPRGEPLLLEGQPFLDATCDVKNLSGCIQVRAIDPFYGILLERIQKEGWATPASDDFVLSGCETERRDECFRRVSHWLRGLGWQTQKTNHALRAYAGSQVAMRYKIYAASVWLRHSSVKVTEGHYSYFIQKHKVEDVSRLLVKWATSVAATTSVGHRAPSGAATAGALPWNVVQLVQEEKVC